MSLSDVVRKIGVGIGALTLSTILSCNTVPVYPSGGNNNGNSGGNNGGGGGNYNGNSGGSGGQNNNGNSNGGSNDNFNENNNGNSNDNENDNSGESDFISRGVINTERGVFKVDINGDKMFVGERGGIIEVYNISDELSPVRLGKLVINDDLTDFDADDGGRLYVAEAFSGIGIYDISGLPDYELVGRAHNIGGAFNSVSVKSRQGFLIHPEHIHVANSPFGYLMINVEDFDNPFIVEQKNFHNESNQLVGAGKVRRFSGPQGQKYVAVTVQSDGESENVADMHIFDVGTEDPFIVDSHYGSGSPIGIATDNSQIYLFRDNGGFKIFDQRVPLVEELSVNSQSFFRDANYSPTIGGVTMAAFYDGIQIRDPSTGSVMAQYPVEDGIVRTVDVKNPHTKIIYAGVEVDGFQVPGRVEILEYSE